MHQFGWLSERREGGGGRGGNFLNLLQKEGGTQKEGSSLRKGGVPILKETIKFLPAVLKPSLHSINYWEVNIVREFEL